MTLSSPAVEPRARKRGQSVAMRILAAVLGAVVVIIGALLGLVAFALLVYPAGPGIAVALAVVVTAVTTFFLNRARRAIFHLGRRRRPIAAIATTAVVAAALTVVVLIPGKTYESTGSIEEGFGVAPQMIETHTGDEIAVYVQRPTTPNGQAPLLFINGGPGLGPGTDVKDFLQRYVDLGYTTYAFDPLGVRQSPPAASPKSYSIGHEAEVIGDILDHYQIAQANLLANSYGGNVAARYIAQAPDRVHSYLAIDTAPVYSTSDNRPGDTGGDDDDAPRTAAPDPDAPARGSLDLRQQIRFLLIGSLIQMTNSDRPPFGSWDEIDYSLTATAAGTDPDGRISARLYAQPSLLINNSMTVSPDFTKHLSEITSPPVLVAHPEFGIVPWQVHAEYPEFFSNTRFLAVAGANHAMWDTAEGADALVTAGDALFRGNPIPDEYTSTDNPFPPLDE